LFLIDGDSATKERKPVVDDEGMAELGAYELKSFSAAPHPHGNV
jgi:hypothetical protein